jgi:integrase/recombinase XerD
MKRAAKPDTFASIDRFLEVKQALGRRYAVEQKVLESVKAFMSRTGAADWTQSGFDHWCQLQAHVSPTVRRSRMRIVRNFCLYRRRTDPDCFVPDSAGFPQPHQPVRPHIFTDAEIVKLLETAARLAPTPGSPLRSQVFRLAIVLLYTTGMRRGELARLTLSDVDQSNRTLLIRQSKFHKSRCLPLSSDASRELDNYLALRRDRHLPMEVDSHLLWDRYANGYSGSGLYSGIHELLRVSGVLKVDGHLPRCHDLRHSFALRRLLLWYYAGVDVQAKLPMLATYMGHVNINSTAYYLPFVEELAAAASQRFASRFGALVRPLREGGVS